MTNKKIQKAIELVGTQTKLAEACGVSQPTVLKWLNGGGISAEYLLKIEAATNGQVTIREICEELGNATAK
ncbi:TPA: helix-turn-helix domain-containing protein [Mannheimia haemolytica]|uniref:Cro family repressor n=8 Tax=root TaxID=1 RepID=R9QDP9_9CAUD|nr:helix-turn-helix domain-containing protein [Mannheimia haemolytica]YP_009207788.1 transcriptional repressor [Mannheimia phage vB_MhM_587AP1]YP_009785020.1 transcriptional repressor [Mannheimia phage vB_MhM_1127AP1]YP_655503.1 transcriptional repressor [Mannheimia phage PHL101]ABD90637.1 Cro repressor [Mannheimia phage phiMhaA1-BAA410]AFL46484.1 Cro family repressor [Mannheimia phage vB_MhM_1152AP]AJA72908.1 Cro repressor [Mannheimia phage vB_MhM_535AP1]AJA73140.1 Cro repressor [Mannheimia